MAPWFGWLQRGPLGTESDRATFRTLHTASLAAPALRAGLTAPSAEKSVRFLKALLGAPVVALTDTDHLLAWDGGFNHHADQAAMLAQTVVADGATSVADKREIPCDDPQCVLRHVIVSPLTVEERVVGRLDRRTSRPARRVDGPLAFVAMIAGSLMTQHRLPPNVSRTMVRLHTPEAVELDRGPQRL